MITTREQAIEWLTERYPMGASDHYADEGPLTFYGGPFSNFVGGPIRMSRPHDEREVLYRTVEHYFQACKAQTLEDHEKVRLAPGPWEAKAAGRRIRMSLEELAHWDTVKYNVMLEILRVKFEPRGYWAQFLTNTGERYIAEDSPTDPIWGLWDPYDPDGPRWSGKNMLGELLMKVRKELTTI